MEEWSLQAVVRGTGDDCESARVIDGSCFGPLDARKEYDQALLFSFPDLFETTTVLGNELEELYKPFYPVYDTFFPPRTISSSTTSMEAQAQVHRLATDVKQEVEEKKMFCGSPSVSTPSFSQATKPKRRKNQQKRVVLQVAAEGLSSDLWAWRKYGQKPIKGSPHPRSYYRCSSSKGCLARRQVEQSCTDPGIYIVTYTAEHNHPQPTRRNSLAGVNRHKFRTTPKSPTISDGTNTVKSKDNSQSPSPTTSPSFSSVDEDVLQQKPMMIKQERGYSEDDDHELMMVGESDENDFLMPDMIFSDDFFVGLEDLDGLNSDLSFYNSSNKKYPVLL